MGKCNILRDTEVDQYDVVDRVFFSEHYSLSPSVTISPNILSSTIDVMVLLTNSFAKQNTKNLRDFSTDERPSASHVVLCSMMLVVTGF